MEVMLAKKSPLSKLAEPMTMYPQELINVRVRDKKAALSDPEVQAAVRETERALGDAGRILLRESGTEPVLRVMVEAESKELCREYAGRVAELIRKRAALSADGR